MTVSIFYNDVDYCKTMNRNSLVSSIIVYIINIVVSNLVLLILTSLRVIFDNKDADLTIRIFGI